MRKTSLILTVLACSAWFLVPAWAGEIRGHITISRNLTKRRISIPDYQMRGVALATPPGESSIEAEYKRLAVYLDGAATAQERGTAALFQRNKRFEPEIVVIPVGSTVSFPNADPIFHNVFSLSPARKFDLGYYPAGESRAVKFDRTGVVQVYCHLHPDMNAAIVVAPSRWYAQPGPDGAFAFSEVPAGAYQVVVWHKSAGSFRKPVEVTELGSREVSFIIPLAAGSAP